MQPMDLVKVRMQGEGRLLPGQKPRYSGVMNAYATIVRQEGIKGLWTGWGPAVMRNSIINATELASYDTAKEVSVGCWPSPLANVCAIALPKFDVTNFITRAV